MIVYRQKEFDTFSHYTTSDGARGIMADKKINGCFIDNSVSTYHNVYGDDIRVNDSNMYDLYKTHIKRNNRIGRLNDKDSSAMADIFMKYIQGEVDDETGEYMELSKNEVASRLASIARWGDDELNRTVDELKSLGASNSEINEFRSKAVKCANRLKRTELDLAHNPKLPVLGEHRQILSIDGLGNGNWKNHKPVYRVIFNTNDKFNKRLGADYNEIEINSDDINNRSLKVEIPKGMDKSHLLLDYIDDLDNIGEENYNIHDINTKKALENLKRKKEFLSRGHGKRGKLVSVKYIPSEKDININRTIENCKINTSNIPKALARHMGTEADRSLLKIGEIQGLLKKFR